MRLPLTAVLGSNVCVPGLLSWIPVGKMSYEEGLPDRAVSDTAVPLGCVARPMPPSLSVTT